MYPSEDVEAGQAPPLRGLRVSLRKRPRGVTLRRKACANPDCGKLFEYQRSTARFCPGGACKQRAHRRNLKAGSRDELPPHPPLAAAEEVALMRRHEAALQLLGQLDEEERRAALYEVVRPSERLRALERGAEAEAAAA
jgi:hypothetical protein